MLHFTFTGFNAGKTLCGVQRNQQDSFRHIPGQAEVRHIINMHGVESICPECLLAWSMSFTTDDDCAAPDDPRVTWCPSTEQWVKDLALNLHRKTQGVVHATA